MPQARSQKDDDHLGKLEAAANGASKAAAVCWITLISLGAYLALTLTNVSHKDLLVGKTLELSIIHANLSLVGFFLVAPFVFQAIHVYLVILIYGLSRRIIEFREEAARASGFRADQELFASRLDLFPVTQYLSGQRRVWIARLINAMIVWSTVVIGPVLLMIFFEVRFLPYHDHWITWYHRALVTVQLFVLLPLSLISFTSSPRLLRPPLSRLRSVQMWFTSIVRWAAILTFVFAAEVFAIAVATVPNEPVERATLALVSSNFVASRSSPNPCGDGVPTGSFNSIFCLLSPTAWVQSTRTWHGEVWTPTLVLFEGQADEDTRQQRSPFSRTLFLLNFEYPPSIEHGGLTVSNRDLRYATLTGAVLGRSVFTAVKLDYARLEGANLAQARFLCTPSTGQNVPDRYVATVYAPSDAVYSDRCTSLLKVNLSGATLHDATFSSSDLREANFNDAKMHRVAIDSSDMDLIDLREAEIYGAKISGTFARGAKAGFLFGAGSLISYVDFSGANLTGAVFDRSVIDTVNFSGSSLNQVSANCSILKKTDLTAARLRGGRLNGVLLKEPTFFATDFTSGEMQACPFDSAHPGPFSGADLNPASEALVQTRSRFKRIAEIRNEGDELVNSWPTVSDDDPAQIDVLAKKIVDLACSNVSIAIGIWDGMNASPRSFSIGSAIMEGFRAARNDHRCLGLKGWFNY